MFSLICAWINGWVNNREAGDLRRHRTHHDVTLMLCLKTFRRVPEPRRYGTMLSTSDQYRRGSSGFTGRGAINFPSKAGNAVTPKDIVEIDLNQTTREHCTDNSTVYLPVCSGQQQRKIKPPQYWPFERGINRSTMVSPYKWTIIRKAYRCRAVSFEQ